VTAPGEAVRRLADELVEVQLTAQPLWRSLLGLPGEHDRLADPSLAAEAATRAACLDIAERVTAVDPGTLDTDDAVTREVVLQQAAATVDQIDSGTTGFLVSDSFSAPVLQVLVFLPEATLPDEDRARGFLARLASIPSFVDALIERQRAAVAGGLVPPEFLTDAGIAYVDRYLGDPGRDPLRIDGPGADFARERDRLLADSVRPAYARYRDFLATEVKPRSLPEEQAGLCWLPGGAGRYAALIRVHTTTERSAQDLHDTGLALIEALAVEYAELGARVFGTSDPAEVFDRLRTDPALRWNTGEELLEAARSTITRAEAAAPAWFLRLPRQACEVQPVPEAEGDGGTIAYYIEPALDGSRPGVYFANTFQAHERFRHTAEAIAFHEAVPGHHFQLSTLQELSELPLLRRIAEVNAFTEGWGLYAERLADEMGLYSGDVTRFGMLTQDSMRAGRLVVDTGLHALGWSRQRAVDFLRENTPMAPMEIEAEIDRYAGCPGQALSYMVGRLEIQRIRREAERALGERFDIRAFHDMVLGHGNLPLPLLDRLAQDWVASASR
jgi:uncharacterized protein (DUF885 family)